MPPKRKRQAAAATTDAPEADSASVEAPQDAPDATPSEPSRKSKRTRASSRASSVATPKIKTNDLDIEDDEDDSMEVDESNASGAQNGIDKGVNGEAGKMRMEAPPKAGLVDPVGYETNPPPEGRPVRVYADGVFDLFHLGHMRALQQAKTAFPNTYLLVGVTGNSETHRRKGLTVLSAAERAESVRHCKWVDEVIEDCPWICTPEFLEQHSIDYVAHDDIPYGAAEGDDIYGAIKAEGKFLVTQRTEGVSTTGIITKIVRDYENYVGRQLQRGQSRKELNISWLKKNELDIKRHVKEVGEAIKTNWSTTGQELGRDFRQFWMPGSGISRPTSPAVGTSDGGSVRGRRSRPAEMNLTSPITPATAAAAGGDGTRSAAQSPGAWSRFSVGTGAGRDRDFVAGYAMGLLGSVRGWMQRNRRNLADSDLHADTDDGGMTSPVIGGDNSSSGSDDDGVHGGRGHRNGGTKRKENGGSLAPESVVDRLEKSVVDQTS